MGKKFILNCLVLFSFSGIVAAKQIIHLESHTSKLQPITWYTENSDDDVLFDTGKSGYSLLISLNRMTDGHRSCTVDLKGCGNVMGLEAGDVTICHPDDQGVFVIPRCASGSENSSASGTVEFFKE